MSIGSHQDSGTGLVAAVDTAVAGSSTEVAGPASFASRPAAAVAAAAGTPSVFPTRAHASRAVPVAAVLLHSASSCRWAAGQIFPQFRGKLAVDVTSHQLLLKHNWPRGPLA